MPILRFLEIKPEGAPTRDAQEAAAQAQDELPPVVPATTSATASPDDRLEQALQEQTLLVGMRPVMSRK